MDRALGDPSNTVATGNIHATHFTRRLIRSSGLFVQTLSATPARSQTHTPNQITARGKRFERWLIGYSGRDDALNLHRIICGTMDINRVECK